MSKGSNPRPFDIPREVYESNHDRIFGKRERKPWTPPPLPDEPVVDGYQEKACDQ